MKISVALPEQCVTAFDACMQLMRVGSSTPLLTLNVAVSAKDATRVRY
jgi:hypothetical protein